MSWLKDIGLEICKMVAYGPAGYLVDKVNTEEKEEAKNKETEKAYSLPPEDRSSSSGFELQSAEGILKSFESKSARILGEKPVDNSQKISKQIEESTSPSLTYTLLHETQTVPVGCYIEMHQVRDDDSLSDAFRKKVLKK